MTGEELKKLCKEMQEKGNEILGLKEADYSYNDERLWNFKAIADVVGMKPSQVALILWMKHVVAIAKHIMEETGDWAYQTVSGEGLKQKFIDAENYLPLIAGCLEEERNPKKETEADNNAA